MAAAVAVAVAVAVVVQWYRFQSRVRRAVLEVLHPRLGQLNFLGACLKRVLHALCCPNGHCRDGAASRRVATKAAAMCEPFYATRP